MKMEERRSPGEHHSVQRNGKSLQLRKHDKQFTIHCPLAEARNLLKESNARVTRLGANVSLVACGNSRSRNRLMKSLRQQFVVHHVYTDVVSRTTVILGDHVYVRFQGDRSKLCIQICAKFALTYVDSLGGVDVLQLSRETGCNPLKLALQLRELDFVESCVPEFLTRTKEAAPRLSSQWHLSDSFIIGWQATLLTSTASIDVERAWKSTRGSPDIVIAVMDDGFDLAHDAFSTPGKIHIQRMDFVNAANGAEPTQNDFHGTPVAAIALADCSEIQGVAPGCTFLPLRVDTDLVSAHDIIRPFRHASLHADVLSISLEMSPQSFVHDVLVPQTGFIEELRIITTKGGRRKKGLVVVVAAGNSDLPISIKANENNVRREYFTESGIKSFSSGSEIFTGYPNLPGVIVVSASTSKLRKSGYSNWGSDITVCACSDNADPLSRKETPDFPGASIVTAVNKNRGKPLQEDSTGSGFTRKFGGTSAATPIVAGVAGLVISANPDLEAWEVRRILEATAFKDMDITIDTSKEPNLKMTSTTPMDGSFVNGKSILFGSGRVNANRATARALAYKEMIDGSIVKSAEYATPIVVHPNDARGVAVHVRLSVDQVSEIRLKVKGNHADAARLIFTLITPEGFLAILTLLTSAVAAFDTEFTTINTVALKTLVESTLNGSGRWGINIQNIDPVNVGIISKMTISVK